MIKSLHDSALASGDGGTSMHWTIDWIRGLGYEEDKENRYAIVLGTFAYLGLVMTVAQGVLVRRLAGRASEGTMAVSGTVVSTLSLLLLSVAVSQESFTLAVHRHGHFCGRDRICDSIAPVTGVTSHQPISTRARTRIRPESIVTSSNSRPRDRYSALHSIPPTPTLGRHDRNGGRRGVDHSRREIGKRP